MQDTHTAEYILIEPDVILSDYDTARGANSGSITAAFTCDVSLVTKADEPGSLDPQEDCVITFDSTRPLVWEIPVPLAGDGSFGRGKSLKGCGFNACEFKVSKDGKPGKSTKAPKRARRKL